MTDSLATRLKDRAATLIIGKSDSSPGPDQRRTGQQDTLPRLADRIATDGNSTEIYAALLDLRGQAVTVEHPSSVIPSFVPGTPSSDNLLRSRQNGSAQFITTLTSTGQVSHERGLAYLIPVSSASSNGQSSDVVGYILLAASINQSDVVLGQLRFILLTALFGALILALLLGLPLARFGLAPLKKMSRTAARIGRGDLSQRVDLPVSQTIAPDDEVQQLAQAFNLMLDQIEQSFQKQQQSETRTRQFAADASHELRSPLTVLGGYLDVLLMGAKDDPVRALRVLQSMRREVDRMSRLVVDLLALTRMDADGGGNLRIESIRVAEILQSAVEDMQVIAGERKIELQFSPESAQAYLTGDNDQLHRVFVNLLDNAIRYTDKDGLIKITTAIVDKGRSVEISLADNGCGISEEQLTHIFDRFYRADPSRSRQTGNAGLGLSIVKSIVEAHDGSIRVVSEVRQGTCFTLRFPLSEISEAEMSFPNVM
ncbi:MAG: HAMP domain-containing protein [Chloroflexi bacterium]|uniref:histidine kinase n=1 Tax=Candidatus Chlorohelix allophototropha TaxID=3003348 RepID=A0A8T7M6F6_9CHLR|nr:HAMP domain-containing protein [Chloroflexota bacterium]WJW69605.1 HAMP domain-containing histidine kinase [Chloroflexota bacterium L227-S17]